MQANPRPRPPPRAPNPPRSFPKSGNRAFTLATALWAFQRRGVLRVSEPRHRVAGGPLNPELYRVNDDALFEIDVLEEADGVARPYKWVDVWCVCERVCCVCVHVCVCLCVSCVCVCV